MDDWDIMGVSKVSELLENDPWDFGDGVRGPTSLPVLGCVMAPESSLVSILLVVQLCSSSCWWGRAHSPTPWCRLGLVTWFGQWNMGQRISTEPRPCDISHCCSLTCTCAITMKGYSREQLLLLLPGWIQVQTTVKSWAQRGPQAETEPPGWAQLHQHSITYGPTSMKVNVCWWKQ